MNSIPRGGVAVAALLLLCYLAFFHKLGDLAFIGADEARYAEVAREMVELGDYVTPHLDYRPWFEKPPFYYWAAAASFRLFGVSEFSARLASAVLASAGVLFVFFFGRKVFSARTGWLSALILLSSALYFGLGRAASTDLGLAVMLTLGLGCFYLGLISKRPTGILFFLAAYAFFGLAVLAKGPIGILLPVLVILGYLVVSRQYHKVYEIHLLPGLLIFFLVVAPWYILVIERHRFAFIASFFLNHNLARFFTRLHHHTQPPYYFLAVILIGFFPWSLFLPSSLRRLGASIRRPEEPHRAILFLWMWASILTLFFSLSQSKLAGYILPAIPALALLIGKEWDAYLSDAKVSSLWFRIGVYIYIGAAAFLVVALPAFLQVEYQLSGVLPFSFALPYAAGGLAVWLSLIRRARSLLFYTLTVTPLLLILMIIYLLFPVIETHQSVKEVSMMAGRLSAGERSLVTYQFDEYNLRYYSGFRSVQVTENPKDLLAILQTRTIPLYCIALTKGLPELEHHPQLQTTRVFARGNKVLLRVQTR